ncbi:MAG: acyl-CoA/acyl-ACP dehydrogenase [Actinobacteria bacterium]|nr:acyl-CoA/acyl-ACP dehydrogenase [Actinomycetota bacterium]
MDFEFSGDQELLRDSVRRFLADRAPLAFVRARLDDDRGTTDEVWRGLCALGVTGLLAPEDHGGAGMGMVDAAVALEEIGRALYPGPYASSAIGAVSLVVLAGSPREHSFLLTGLTSGDTIGTIALLEPAQRYEWRTPITEARPAGEQCELYGTKVHVPDAADAGLLLVTAHDHAGMGVYGVDVGDAGVEVQPSASVDGTRKEGTVVLDGARGWRMCSGDATAAVAEVLDRLATAAVVDGVGTAARALELAVDYAKERVQFDHPIGSFQAVQHLCADMLRAVELARAGAYYACWAADAGDPTERHRAATMAKAFASDELYRVGATAVQVFGGIGFTWEHDIHLYLKRLMSLQRVGGGSDEHLDALARLILD